MGQWRKDIRGWNLTVTVGQGGGFGIVWHSPVRWNGISFLCGPIIIDVQPPMPKWAADQIVEPK